MTGQRPKPGLSLGPVLMLISLYFFWQMGAVPARAVNPRDPGPRFWPTSLAVCLLAAGFATTAHAIAARLRPSRRAERHPAEERERPSGEGHEFPGPANLSGWIRDWGVQNAAVLLVALPIYVLAIHWFGYVVCTMVFSTIVLARLWEPSVAAALERRTSSLAGQTPAWKIWGRTLALSALVSAALVASIILLFDRVFDRPLPQGEFITLPF
jgi:hypothetical protein